MNKKMKANPGKWTWMSMIYELTLKNVMDLKNDLSEVVGYIPSAWAFLVKHFIPPIILVLFALGESSSAAIVLNHCITTFY